MKIGRFYLKLCLKNSPKFWQAFLRGIMSYSWVAADLYIGGTTSPINHSRQLCGFHYLPGLETSAFGSPAPPFPRNDQLQEEKGKGDLCESWRERFSSGNIWEEVDVLSERRWTVIQSDVLHQVSDWWKYCWIRKRLSNNKYHNDCECYCYYAISLWIWITVLQPYPNWKCSVSDFRWKETALLGLGPLDIEYKARFMRVHISKTSGWFRL